jgi:hypothetical protein
MVFLRIALSTILVAIALGCAPPAQATFAGTNGRILYVVEGSKAGQRLIDSAFLGPEGGLVPDQAKLLSTGVDNGGDAFDPSVSADGRTLAFASTRSGRSQIYSFGLNFSGNSTGSRSFCRLEVCSLTNGPGESYEPAWAPDGRSIVFVSTREGSAQIYRMTATGEQVARLTFDDATDQQPTWSQSGQIAFVSNQSGTDQIYVMNGQGGELRQVTHGTASTRPSWSPSGTELAYASKTPTGCQIFVLQLASGQAKQLTSALPDSGAPAWSPDATKLLVTRGPDSSGVPHLEVIAPRSGVALSRPAYLAPGEAGTWAPLPPAAPSAPPPVTPGVTAIAHPLSGNVEVNPTHPLASAMAGEMSAQLSEAGHPTPASKLTRSVEAPVNSTYNATNGMLKLTVASAATHSTSTAIVSGGLFRLEQRTATAIPTIRLIGRPHGCRRGGASIARRGQKQPRLAGHTHRRWKIDTNDNMAESPGTRWEVTITCRGTLYRAIEHYLLVTDPLRRHPILVTAGHQYLVRAESGRRHA